MPHKRAKHSDRVAKRFSLGQDLAPGADDGFFSEMPKGAMRILQGAKVQEAYREKLQAKKKAQQEALTKAKDKAKASDASAADTNNATAASQLTIRPGEKLRDFNARVEQAMASDVRASFRSATRSQINARKRERRKLRAAGIDPDADPESLEEQESARKAKADKAAALQASEPSSADLKRQRQAIQQTGEIKDFAKATQVKKINDVAQAPPTLTRAPRGESVQAKTRKARLMAKITGNDEDEAERKVKQAEMDRQKGRVPAKLGAAASSSSVAGKKRKSGAQAETASEPSMARQRVLEEERERAIKSYRQIKEKKIQANEAKRLKKV
ncbi:hypothetical protein EX895_000660 [Sporisorium graminicola]|uniref:Uncharacterized protein n=1 Tax=Sporisorium graminicola TaxID=280036 RepID=A0A4U7L597_9BASI|nr:hypothetical protein EX895_000660 [Sporisorium graminicola]TKY90662.1 hypothetical protein EX895_000660 [Sporisorium graminicola]